LTLAWFAALRFAPKFFLISPAIGWLACFFTVAVCLLQERRLLRETTIPFRGHDSIPQLQTSSMN
jgi:hypothetical protein